MYIHIHICMCACVFVCACACARVCVIVCASVTSKTSRKSVCLYSSGSVSVSVPVSVSVSDPSLSLSPSPSLSLSQSLSLFLSLSLSQFLPLSLSPFPSLSLSLSVFLSAPMCLCLCLCLCVYPLWLFDLKRICCGQELLARRISKCSKVSYNVVFHSRYGGELTFENSQKSKSQRGCPMQAHRLRARILKSQLATILIMENDIIADFWEFWAARNSQKSAVYSHFEWLYACVCLRVCVCVW